MFALVGGEPGGAWWAEMLLCIAAAYLIARLVHAESIPGVNQFWVTRPYRSWSLLAAKLMFVVVFISLPSGLAQLYIVVQAGFSPGGIATGLLWSQFVTFLALILPMTALAAVTTGIMPFIFVSLVVLAIGFSTQPAVMLLMNRPPAYSAWPVAVEWVREAGIEIVLTASAACVLFIQYKFRRTNASRLVSVAGLAAAAWHYMPWRFGLSVQELLSPSDAVYGTLNVSPDPVMKATQSSAPGRAETRVQVRVPVVVTSEAPIVADAFTATFRAADGRSWSVDGGGVNRTGRGSDTFELTMLMPRSFLAEAGGMDLTAQGTIWFTQFRDSGSRRIRLRDGTVNVTDGLQCFAGPFSSLWRRSAFRWPNRLIYAKVGEKDIRSLTSLISYSPFPGGIMNFNPIETRWAPGTVRPNQEITIVWHEPVAHVRREFHVGGIRLAGLRR